MSGNLYKENTKPINILFVGGGRRNTLAGIFKDKGCNVYSYEIDRYATISEEATIIIGEKFNSPNFVDNLKSCIDIYEIDLVIPLQDQAVPLCENIKNCVCSKLEASTTCLDKKIFERFMLENFPKFYPKIDAGKVIKKPRFGYGSNGIKILDAPDHFSNDYVYQSYKVGREYTVDAYFDKSSKIVGASPRERLRTAGGEVIESITVNMPNLVESTKQIGERLKLIGPICMQYIVEPSGDLYLFEINCRFGGGSTLSIAAGFDMIDMLKKEYIDCLPICASSYKIQYNMVMKRFFKDVYFLDK